MEPTSSINSPGNDQPHLSIPIKIDQNTLHPQENHSSSSSSSQETPPISSLVISNKHSNAYYFPLLLINFLFLFVGSVSSSLLSKYYFNHKGSSIWVSTWVQSAGFPLLFPPIFLPFYLFKTTQRKPFSHFTPRIFTLSIVIGLLLGLNNLLFSLGNSYLPVSTSSLLLSSQLAFTLILSVIIVKQKITFSNLNCVVLLVTSSFLLALGSNHDKPEDLTKTNYFLGFVSTVGAGLLFALYLPVMEKIYREVYCYAMVVEMQVVMEVAATVLATIGMAVEGGFSDMRKESLKAFDKGPAGYWISVFSNVVTWQLCFVGTAGMVFMTTSLTGGICMTALMAVNVLGGVVVYGDKFGGVKAVSTVLTLWGFSSYVYGMYIKTSTDPEETDHHTINNNHHSSPDHHHGHHDHNNVAQGMEMVPIYGNA
ncbi:hypothetical protein TIFTF001_036166 [Ficus carica]|uniref:Probable purine permease n=1 Tax=Ficus carica TaxID=3494 RepID=A0AA88E3Q7_FICCA|nr:hypothetical protein TIFTF001_036166 [Ficus carica]